MKKFLVFVGDDHYPEGGGLDFYKAFDDLEDAVDSAHTEGEFHDWAQVCRLGDDNWLDVIWQEERGVYTK